MHVSPRYISVLTIGHTMSSPRNSAIRATLTPRKTSRKMTRTRTMTRCGRLPTELSAKSQLGALADTTACYALVAIEMHARTTTTGRWNRPCT